VHRSRSGECSCAPSGPARGDKSDPERAHVEKTKEKEEDRSTHVVCTRQRKQTVDGFESAELVSTPRPVQVETSRRLISFNYRCMGTWACQL
jgi:hypothetical protein